jgi:adenylylsulfate kinase-like enzyme
MKQIIIIHGPMASGKSTITNKLNEILKDYTFVDRAYIKDIMLGKLRKKNPDLARKISKDAMFTIMKDLMKNKQNILLQEIRLPSVKKHLKKELKNYKIISFYLDCSLKTALKRDTTRQTKYKRPLTVEEMHKNHAYEDDGDIIINTEKNTIKQTIDIILKNTQT